MAPSSTTWILTGSPENFEVTRERGFRLIGKLLRERMTAAAGVRA